MDKKLVTTFVVATLGGLTYSILKQRRLEKSFIGVCEAFKEFNEQQMQIVTDMQFEDIVEHYDE